MLSSGDTTINVTGVGYSDKEDSLTLPEIIISPFSA